MASDVLTIMRQRVAELEPLVAEHEELRKAIAALERVQRQGKAAGKRTRSASSGTTRRRGRPPGSGSGGRRTRADQFVALVRERPGITVVEAAEALGIENPTSLYNVARKAADRGDVVKRDTGFHPPDAAPAQ